MLRLLRALHHRQLTGRGQRVELNLMTSMLSVMVNFAGAYALTGDVAHGSGIQHPSICPYEPFPTGDRLLVIAAGNDRQFRELCECLGLGLGELALDPRSATNGARVAHRDQLTCALVTVLVTWDADQWSATLSAAGIPCGPINGVAQAMALAQSLGLQPIIDVQGSAQVANPLRLSATGVSYRHRSPALGGVQEEILAWLDGGALADGHQVAGTLR